MTCKPKKIAFLLPSLKFGGAERVALNLAMALKANGIQIDVLLMSYEGEFLAEAESHFNMVNMQCNKTYKLPGRLWTYLVRHRPDALISSFWKLNLCACFARLYYPRIKLILWEHSPPSKSKNSPTWLYAITASVAYHASTKVVAVSTGVFKDINQITLGLRRKMLVIFNPIVAPSSPLLIRPVHQGQKQVIWVGRLDDPKNPGLMLEAFALVSATCNARLVFLGDGPMRSELEHRCKELGLWERVSFMGFLSAPYDLMVHSDLLVLSSDREGLPSVIIEAMYCGLRVVSTDCGEGIHDILLDGRYGTIVQPKDKAALARAIEDELNMLQNAERQISGAQRFLPSGIAQQFLRRCVVMGRNEASTARQVCQGDVAH